MYRLVYLFAFLTALPDTMHSQQPVFTNYTMQEGLVSNNVRRIYQDSKGFIWIATWDGLSHFNGHKFINYSTLNGLSHSLVNDFAELDGEILVLLNDGSIDGIRNGVIRKVAKVTGDVNNFATGRGGKLIVATSGAGIYEYQNGGFIKPRQDTPPIELDAYLPVSDSLGIGISPGRLYRMIIYGNNYKARYSVDIPTEVVTAISYDSEFRIWLCTEKGLRVIERDPRQLNYFLSRQLPVFIPAWVGNTGVFFVQKDSLGSYWIGTTRGLLQIDKKGHQFHYTEKDGLPSIRVTAMFIDKEKNIWLGTAGGLVKISTITGIEKVTATNYTEITDVMGMRMLANQQLLLTTLKGPKIYDPATQNLTNIPFSGEPPLFVIPGSDPIMFCDSSGIGYFDSSQKKIVSLFRGQHIMTDRAYCEDRKGNVYFGSHSLIGMVASKKVWLNRDLNTRVTCLASDHKNNIWAGTWWSGLYRITYDLKEDSLFSVISDFSHLVPDKHIRSLFTDKEGNIWVGTRYKGIFRLRPIGNDNYEVISIGQQQGLSSNYVLSFAEAPNGDLWAGTFYGINKLVKTEKGFDVFNFSRISNFFPEINQIAYFNAHEWFWIADRKLFRFRDGNMENLQPLRVEITSVLLGVNKDKINIVKADTFIRLKHDQNQASFKFSAPGFINEKQLQYSYRLLGSNDTSWSAPENVHEVSYASLQPGNYTFQVRVTGWNAVPGPISTFSFRISPPFWKTTWFNLLILTGVAGILYLVFNYRLRQLKRLQQVRNSIATDLHDDIGSALSNISILTELSQRNKNQPAKSGEYLERIKEEIEASGQALDDIIWSVNSRNDSFTEIAARMRRYAAEIFDAHDIQYELELDPTLYDRKMVMEQRRDIYMIFKEILNNIHKHAKATLVLISLFEKNDNIILVIKDNGRGFDSSLRTTRNGMNNIAGRVRRWNGKLTVLSERDKGTEISIQIPLSRIAKKRDV
jgi:ligand-binding sensor domain-containing protein/two-component sensor histidine kinase